MDFAFSTSWNAFRHRLGRNIIKEVSQLGFKNLELSFNLTPLLLKDIAAEISNQGIKVRSLHNYCPIPEGLSRKVALPDCFSLASLDEKERHVALEYTKRSIDTALQLQAEALVLHCGRVEMPDLTREMCILYTKS